jgi:hypothetical protein
MGSRVGNFPAGTVLAESHARYVAVASSLKRPSTPELPILNGLAK